MSTPAPTTTIVATETVHLTLPILVGNSKDEEDDEEEKGGKKAEVMGVRVVSLLETRCFHSVDDILPTGRQV